MKITFSPKHVIILVLIVVCISTYLVTRKQLRIAKETLEVVNADLLNAKKEIKEKEVLIAGINQKLFTSEAIVISSQKALKYSEEEKEYYKKLHLRDIQMVSKLNLEIEVLKKQGQYRDTIIRADTVIVDTVKTASYSDKYAWVNVILKDKPEFNFGMDVPLRVNVGYKLFKPTVIVSTPNPYVTVDKNSTVIVHKKNIWNRKYPYLIVGGVIGFLIK